MRKILHRKLILLTFVFFLFGSSACSQNNQDQNKNYIYYLHGRIVEDLGADKAVSERFGKYEYKKILKTFEDKGFEVISEARPKDTDVKKYSTKLARQIKEQIKNGVSPDKITVVGASKGSLIAMLTSTKLANKDVKFVIMGNCNDWILENYEVNLHGKILSIYEKSDTIGGNSCGEIKQNSKGVREYKEIEINTKLDHGFLYKPLKEWVEPTINLANNPEVSN